MGRWEGGGTEYYIVTLGLFQFSQSFLLREWFVPCDASRSDGTFLFSALLCCSHMIPDEQSGLVNPESTSNWWPLSGVDSF